MMLYDLIMGSSDDLDHLLPRGAGFDNGSFIVKRNPLTIETSFHRMNEYGYYCGWESFTITVAPDFTITIEPDNGDLADYVAETFLYCLQEEVQ